MKNEICNNPKCFKVKDGLCAKLVVAIRWILLIDTFKNSLPKAKYSFGYIVIDNYWLPINTIHKNGCTTVNTIAREMYNIPL